MLGKSSIVDILNKKMLITLLKHKDTKRIIEISIEQIPNNYRDSMRYMFGLTDGNIHRVNETKNQFSFNINIITYYRLMTKVFILNFLNISQVDDCKDSTFFKELIKTLPMEKRNLFKIYLNLENGINQTFNNNDFYKRINNLADYMDNFLYKHSVYINKSLSDSKCLFDIPDDCIINEELLKVFMRHSSTRRIIDIAINLSQNYKEPIINYFNTLGYNTIEKISIKYNINSNNFAYHIKGIFYQMFCILNQTKCTFNGSQKYFFEMLNTQLSLSEQEDLYKLFITSDNSLQRNNDQSFNGIIDIIDNLLNNSILEIKNFYSLRINALYEKNGFFDKTFYSFPKECLINDKVLSEMLKIDNMRDVLKYAISFSFTKYHKMLYYHFGLNDGVVHNRKETYNLFLKVYNKEKIKLIRESINKTNKKIYEVLASSTVIFDGKRLPFFEAFKLTLTETEKSIYAFDDKNKELSFLTSSFYESSIIKLIKFMNSYEIILPDEMKIKEKAEQKKVLRNKILQRNEFVEKFKKERNISDERLKTKLSDLDIEIMNLFSSSEFLDYLAKYDLETAIILYLKSKNYHDRIIADFLNMTVSDVCESYVIMPK